MAGDADKSPAEVQREAKRILAEITAEKQRKAILKDAQNRADKRIRES